MSAPGVIGISKNILLIYAGSNRLNFFSEIFKLNLVTGIKKTIGHTHQQGRVSYGSFLFENNTIFGAYYTPQKFWQDKIDINHEICSKQMFESFF